VTIDYFLFVQPVVRGLNAIIQLAWLPDGLPSVTFLDMGLTDINLLVSNPHASRRRVSVTFLVDSGTTYSVLPWSAWKRLGLKPEEELEFTLADGSTVKRKLAEARFHLQHRSRVSPVLLGERGDAALLGIVTLETLGLMLNPLRRELVPIRTVLARIHVSPNIVTELRTK
jgi:predicted aspartyl protease